MSYKYNQVCRLDKKSSIKPLINLGEIAFSGLFPNDTNIDIPKVPLEIGIGSGSGLVQLTNTYDSRFMYGPSYGYRSGLNSSMVNHLKNKANYLKKIVNFKNDDAILDIGANDGTFLSYFNDVTKNLIGIDPSAEKFKNFFPPAASYIFDFFSKEIYKEQHHQIKPKLISSIAMFYDLEDPLKFAEDIYDIIHDDGVWHLEQSYILSMLETNSFDTICHEHSEYYSVSSLVKILNQAGFYIDDIGFNDINGGSFWINAKKSNREKCVSSENLVSFYIDYENRLGLQEEKIFLDFKKRIDFIHENTLSLLKYLKNNNKKVFGLGASTKGNILLSKFEINTNLIEFILEVNPDKFGCFTPGTKIPIINEVDGLSIHPDYLLVLPWHFKANLIANYKTKYPNIKLIFPLPNLTII